MKKIATAAAIFILVSIVLGCQSNNLKTRGFSFGQPDDVAYSKELWLAMATEGMVGSKAKANKPFFGGARPHGMILEISYQMVTVNDHSGFVVVKKNYNGDGVSINTVEENRSKYLDSITVMYQREAGYDEDNQNWFWVKYRPDGSLFQKNIINGHIDMAGKISKGKVRSENGGCIYCHSSAGGGDYIFYPEITAHKSVAPQD